MTTPKRWPTALAEAVGVAREYLQGSHPRADTELLVRDFAEVVVQLAATCVVGLPCDRHAGMVHGQEADELRAGVEQILSDNRAVFFGDEDSVLEELRTSLRRLLDRIDARDSLAFLGSTAGAISAAGSGCKSADPVDSGDRSWAPVVTHDDPILLEQEANVLDVQRLDAQRLDWLSAEPSRVLQARLRMLAVACSLREAIDWLVQDASSLLVIFLDVDGVLNSEAFLRKLDEQHRQLGHTDPTRPKHETTCMCYRLENQIDRDAIARLNRLVGKTKAKIVISSSWRKLLDPSELLRVLVSHGLVAEIIGETPDGPNDPDLRATYGDIDRIFRGHEIDAWLKQHPEVKRFVILDDSGDMVMHKNRLVQTDCQDGLLDEHVELAIRMMSWMEDEADRGSIVSMHSNAAVDAHQFEQPTEEGKEP